MKLSEIVAATQFEPSEDMPKVVERAKGILQKQKGIRWDITSMPAGSGRYYVYVKVGPKTARWDSTWYRGSWTIVDKQNFSRTNNSYDLPEDVRSVLFNLSVILPTVGKDVPIRFQVYDEKGNEEHLRLKP